MITQGLLRALDRLNDVGGSGWLEVPTELKVNQESAAFMRQLRLCVKYGWAEEGPAAQGKRWRAYRLTPAGMAMRDQHALRERAIERHNSDSRQYA